MSLIRKFLIICAAAFCFSVFAATLTLNLTFDDFPPETYFGVWAAGADQADIFAGVPYDVDLSSPIGWGDGFVLAGDFIDEVGTFQFYWNLAPGDYTFTMFDSSGNGICCESGEGGYVLSLDGTELLSGGMFEFSESIEFSVTAVPLPAGLVLLLSALGSIGFIRRKS